MRVAYAAPAWSSFVSKEQEGKIDALLRRSFRLGFSQQIFTFRQTAEKADHTLFTSVTNPTHRLHQLLPPTRSTQYICSYVTEDIHTLYLYMYLPAL